MIQTHKEFIYPTVLKWTDSRRMWTDVFPKTEGRQAEEKTPSITAHYRNIKITTSTTSFSSRCGCSGVNPSPSQTHLATCSSWRDTKYDQDDLFRETPALPSCRISLLVWLMDWWVISTSGMLGQRVWLSLTFSLPCAACNTSGLCQQEDRYQKCPLDLEPDREPRSTSYV